jgi:hypothetical protein
MRLSCALVACNDNPKYLDFWQVVKKAWWDIVGIPCVMVYVADTLPQYLAEDPAVIHFKPIPEWPTATQAQVIRLLFPALLQCDGAVMLSDMDMIPLQRDFFTGGFSRFSENQFVSLRGIDEGEKQIYMCYVGATPKTWKDLFGIKSIEDISSLMRKWASEFPADGNHGGLGWCTDQRRLYDKVKEWQIQQPERVGLIPWTPTIPRLDRGNPNEWLHWNDLLEFKLKNTMYIDFHMPPYSIFYSIIDKVLNYTP